MVLKMAVDTCNIVAAFTFAAWQMRSCLLWKLIIPEATVIDMVSTIFNESSSTAFELDCKQSLFRSNIIGKNANQVNMQRWPVFPDAWASCGSRLRHSPLVCRARRLKCTLCCKCSATRTVLKSFKSAVIRSKRSSCFLWGSWYKSVFRRGYGKRRND